MSKINTGEDNSGDRNSGYWNSGNCNSGNCNSGNHNSGDCNSGYCNSGNCNSGNHNSGDCNSGYWNSGNHNSGNHNSGDWNSGFFNTDEPNVRMFNKDTGKKRDEINFPDFMYFDLIVWVNKDDMTEQEKKDYPFWETVGGYLKTLDYKKAWKQAWSKASQEEKEATKKLPNFDPKLFEEITGIKVDDEFDLSGSEVEVKIKGKTYKAVIK